MGEKRKLHNTSQVVAGERQLFWRTYLKGPQLQEPLNNEPQGLLFKKKFLIGHFSTFVPIYCVGPIVVLCVNETKNSCLSLKQLQLHIMRVSNRNRFEK